MAMASTRGRWAGNSATKPRTAPYATASPAAAPPSPRTMLSVSICLTTLLRPAPRAPRMATSRSRAAPRAMTTLATLAQATRSTASTAPNSTASIGRAPPVSSCCIGRTSASRPQSLGMRTGNVGRARSAAARTSPVACATDTPGRNRPTIRKLLSYQYSTRRDASIVAGSHNCVRVVGSAKPRGITPITVRGMPSIVTWLPVMFGSAPNACRHRASLRSTIRSEPGRSSPAWNTRPNAAPTPSSEKRFADAYTAFTRAGAQAASPARHSRRRLTSRSKPYPAMPSNERVYSRN